MDEKISRKLRNGNILIKTVLILMPLTVLMFVIAILTNIKTLTYIATICFVISVPSIVVYIELFAPIRKSQKYLARYGFEDCLYEHRLDSYDLPISKICIGDKSFYSGKPSSVLPYSMIAWVYLQQTKYMGIIPMYEKVIISCRDGKSFEIQANRNELNLLLQQIQKYSPDLIVGYGNEQMKQYGILVDKFKKNR